MAQDTSVSSYCRHCGGERNHTVQRQFRKHVQFGPEDGVDAWEEWQILECRGCNSVSMVHELWNSEQTDQDDEPLITRRLYPPPPSTQTAARGQPDWQHTVPLWFLDIPLGASWIPRVHHEIYQAIGLEAFGIAAMGARAIIDHIVTSQAGDFRPFKEKLERMCKKGLISAGQIDTIDAAYDAGSAAAHRGHIPEREDLDTLLDITENLIEKTYVEPVWEARRAKAAAALRAKTPPRPKRN